MAGDSFAEFKFIKDCSKQAYPSPNIHPPPPFPGYKDFIREIVQETELRLRNVSGYLSKRDELEKAVRGAVYQALYREEIHQSAIEEEGRAHYKSGISKLLTERQWAYMRLRIERTVLPTVQSMVSDSFAEKYQEIVDENNARGERLSELAPLVEQFERILIELHAATAQSEQSREVFLGICSRHGIRFRDIESKAEAERQRREAEAEESAALQRAH